MFCRFIKPNWAVKKLANGENNPDFKEEIQGPNVVEKFASKEEALQYNKKGYNIYYFPNHPSKNIYSDEIKYMSGKYIDTFNYVFIDMDLKDEIYSSKEQFIKLLTNSMLHPNKIVVSGNGVHAYWKVSDLTREDYLKIQFALINLYKTDESVWTVLQLLRIPDSINTKIYRNPKKCETVYENNESFTVSQFSDLIENITETQQEKIKRHCDKLDGNIQINLGHDVNIDEIPDKFIELTTSNSILQKLFFEPKELYKDRSAADYRLACTLFSKGFKLKEVLAVISNTQKALEKGLSRHAYAELTVEKAYPKKKGFNFKTVKQRLSEGIKELTGEPVKGPYFLDYGVLHNSWKKSQILGMIAGTGVGKTAMSLKIFKEMIINNPNDDELFVFFTLEMPESEIIERWNAMTKNNPNLTDRLYVIGNEDEEGEPRNIGIQEIYEYCEYIKDTTGKKIKSVAIDHFMIMGTHIDMNKKYTFGANSERDSGRGSVRTLSPNMLATQLKQLSKMLNTFMIVLTQTTKGKGVGDLPIDKDGAYGVSQYENIMDYVLTLWQPLMRVNDQLPERFTAWQYAKIRNKHKNDKIQTNQYKLLIYDLDSGDFTSLTQENLDTFHEWLPKANEIRKNHEKRQPNSYSITIDKQTMERLHSKLKLIGKVDES